MHYIFAEMKYSCWFPMLFILQLKSSLEEQLAELTGELNTSKAVILHLKEDKKKMEDEIEDTKKVDWRTNWLTQTYMHFPPFSNEKKSLLA